MKDFLNIPYNYTLGSKYIQFLLGGKKLLNIKCVF